MNNIDWKQRYINNQTGWDIGQPSPPLVHYFEQLDDRNINILIPGCGNAYEAEYLVSMGFKNVYVLDFAIEPLLSLKKRVPDFPDAQLICNDFFNYQGQFDLIIEQTFFCSFPKSYRADYVAKTKQLLTSSGKIVGLLFSSEFNTPGPPFGGTKNEYIELFSQQFYIKTLENCYNSISPRMNNELFFIFEKL